MERTERWRLLLIGIRDHWCKGNQADLARRIATDASYVNRLFYPEGKPNGKRVGPDIMEACNKAFSLPRGFWDMTPEEAFAQGAAGEAAGGSATAHKTPSNLGEDDFSIPQYPDGGAMGGGLVLEDKQPGIIRSWNVSREWIRLNVPHYSAIANLCIVTGFGPSMRPLYNPGDPLLLDTGVTTVNTEGVYFFRIGNMGFIKQLQRIPTEEGLILRAKSLNPSYDPFDITRKMQADFQCFGQILTVWKSEQV